MRRKHLPNPAAYLSDSIGASRWGAYVAASVTIPCTSHSVEPTVVADAQNHKTRPVQGFAERVATTTGVISP